MVSMTRQAVNSEGRNTYVAEITGPTLRNLLAHAEVDPDFRLVDSWVQSPYLRSLSPFISSAKVLS